MHVLVIGGGVFGLTAALELRARGHQVTLVDPGPIPHPLAESTDISKVVRCDYGDDLDYTVMGEQSIEGWRRWNKDWATQVFHDTGVAFLATEPMQPGGFEYESYQLLRRRGHRIERLDEAAIPHRYRAYRPGAFVDGYFHAEGGFAEAGFTVSVLAKLAELQGVAIREVAIERLIEGGAIAISPGIDGGPLRERGGERIAADATIVCAGSWTQRLLPELEGSLRAVGQPVFHFTPREPEQFSRFQFPVFGADIARTGYYGFPYWNGVVKIANHGLGREVPPSERATCNVTPAQKANVRELVRDVFPGLAGAPITHTRLCVYGDTLDGHFWIAPHPERPNLVVAAGGSGHAFKFAPVLGPLIADALEGTVVPRFRWRPELAVQSRGDAARSDHV